MIHIQSGSSSICAPIFFELISSPITKYALDTIINGQDMKIKLLTTLFCYFFLLACSNCFSSHITQVHDLKEFEQEVKQLDRDSLVIFDVDNTLIIFEDAVLRPAANPIIKEYYKILHKQYSREESEIIISRVFLKNKIQLVNPNSSDLIRHLQDNNVTTIALTAINSGRYGLIPNLEDWRIEQLNALQIDFSHAFPYHPYLVFENLQRNDSIPVFKKGILCSGKHSKGEVLREFLHHLQWKPKKVVFIDDHMEYLESVQKELEKMGIAFKGYHYLEAHRFPCELKQDLIEAQFIHLIDHNEWLSDDEIQRILNPTCPLHHA